MRKAEASCSGSEKLTWMGFCLHNREEEDAGNFRSTHEGERKGQEGAEDEDLRLEGGGR